MRPELDLPIVRLDESVSLAVREWMRRAWTDMRASATGEIVTDPATGRPVVEVAVVWGDDRASFQLVCKVEFETPYGKGFGLIPSPVFPVVRGEGDNDATRADRGDD